MSLRLAVALACGLVLPAALAQTKAPQQVVKPPVAQAWIDVATFAGMGMPAGGGAPGMGAMMGNLFGGGPGARNSFGNTQAMSPGRWVDVTLATSRNPALAEGVQLVPAGTGLAPQLTLLAPPQAKPAVPDDERVIEQDYERPKGKLYLYWGCGDNVRAGQPRVLDMATANPAAYAQFFVARRATQRGAHSAAGRPLWPNERDARMVPANASLVGEHSFTGQGVPEGFKIGIPAPQDLMPPIELKQAQAGGVTTLEWRAVPHARAYFIAAMGAKSMDSANPEMVFWTSSELPETGMGLIDYQTNAAVDRWLKEKVLLEPAVTRCAVPKGIFPEGGGAMLRMIAYGSELNLAHPPRPADPKQAWEPQWAAKVRVKSVANAMLGMDMPAMMGAPADTQTPAQRETPQQPKTEPTLPDAVNILRGILGR
ncbi:MAG TPA: hypothetical protein P5024_12045 [Burkholderiaceae bacterium]|jgi:hypothetical protein|nr:hypothetical protein [Burkholderiaceae bacterium]